MQLDHEINKHEVTMCGRSFPLNVWEPGDDPVIGALIAIDTETVLIVDHNFPDLVLLQVTAGSRVDLVPYTDAEAYMAVLIRYNPKSRYVFVNAAFDMGVLGTSELYDLVDDGLITDLQDRYKLWDISERGYVRKPASLANMSANVLSVTLKKDDDVRLTFTRDKAPSTTQLVYGAEDVVATWLLGVNIPEMPTESDSQIMGSIVLDAISRTGMLVDREHFDKIRKKFSDELVEELEYLETHGYNPLLGKSSTIVLREGLDALGIDEMPNKASGPILEYLLYNSLVSQGQPIEKFRETVRRLIKECDDEESGPLDFVEGVEHYVQHIQEGFEGKLKRDRVEAAREALPSIDQSEILKFAATVRVNPFKGKRRIRLNILTRQMLDDRFMWSDGVCEPFMTTGVGLHDMAVDKRLCMWPMASVLRELYKSKAGKIKSLPEHNLKTFSAYIQQKAMWYGNYSTEWAECLKPGRFMQARLLSIEQKNPEVVFPRTDGGKKKKDKQIQVSAKDKWIFKKFGIEDKLVETYISYKHNEKLCSTYLNPVHIKKDGRVHTRFENYLKTGRVSSSGPNIQNVPGKDGIRKMYVPKPMHLYASVDYSQLELCSLAQHCFTVFGHSRMRELINADIDLHSWFAAKTSGILTEENDYDGSEESRIAVIAICDDITANHNKLRKNAKACYSADTELLTPTGWRRIDELYETPTEVMQYDPGSKGMTFVKPLRWIKQENKELISFQHSHMDSVVTPEHRMLLRSRDNVCRDVLAEDLEPKDNWQTVHAGYFRRKSTLSELETRLAVMIQADGSLQKKNGTVNGVMFGFTKPDKIERARELLDRSGWKYTTGISKKEVVWFRIRAEELPRVFAIVSECREFLNWDMYEPKAFIEELALWDSRHSRSKKPTGKRQYATVSSTCADVAQLILITSGIRSNKRWEPHNRSETGGCWIVNWYVGARKNYDVCRLPEMKKEKLPGKHTVYCLTVPSSYVVTRHGACCNMLGQCNFGFPGGMSAKTFLKTQRGYGNIDITLEECEELRNNWFAAFPEMNEHMQPTSDVVTDYDRKRFDNRNIRLYRAKNIMGVHRRKCTFNSACNYPFQSLAAVGAKRALWAVWRDGRYAQYMVNFIH